MTDAHNTIDHLPTETPALEGHDRCHAEQLLPARLDGSETNVIRMTMEHPPGGRERAAGGPVVAGASVAVGSAAQPMGALELKAYKRQWRRSYRFRQRTAEIAAEREREAVLTRLENTARDAAAKAMREQGLTPPAAGKRASSASRKDVLDSTDQNEDKATASKWHHCEVHPVTSCRVAARLMFARQFDKRPALLEAFRSAAPVLIVDVPNLEWTDRVSAVWEEVLFDDKPSLMDASGRVGAREDYDAAYLFVEKLPATRDKPEMERSALSALSLALPFIAISPLGVTHLPDAVMKAATDRIEFPNLDPATIVRTIRVVTGRRCPEQIENELAARTTLADLVVAVRFNRTPAQCIAELKRLASLKDSNKKSRELRLSEVHGLGEAKAWAEGAIADIAAWKRGEISWDAVSSAVAITGPPGTGKTLFAKVFAAEAGLNLIAASLAKWQSSGEAHLGHLLRAMRADFDAARSAAPSVIFVDEIDSFPERAALTHSYRDYVIEVVNALLEQIDGLAGREGVVLIAASNDLSRCDPALLRAGRFDRIVKIGLPTIDELERMFRVRLGDALRTEDIRPVTELAIGMTGADVERVVKDAKRAARQTQREITLQDLRGTLAPEDDRPFDLRWRTCVHEACHIVVDVVQFGPSDVFATIARIGNKGGASIRTRLEGGAGTHSEYRKRLEVVLAGRIGEELFLGSASHGAGGVAGSDLHLATTLAAAMVGSLGLAGPTPLTFFGPLANAHDFLRFGELRAAINQELVEAAKSCRAFLDKNRAGVEAVARRLMEYGRIDGHAVKQLLAGDNN